MIVKLILCSIFLLVVLRIIFYRKYIAKPRRRLRARELQMEKEIQELKKSPDFFEVNFQNIKGNFDLFEGVRCGLASNDEEKFRYSVTPIQDLEPNDLA